MPGRACPAPFSVSIPTGRCGPVAALGGGPMDGSTATVHGVCAPGFEPVRDVFAANFRERGALGAAFTALHLGEVVVDLWGGWADPARSREWMPDTLANVWPSTMGISATCPLRPADAGELDVDAPVAKY